MREKGFALPLVLVVVALGVVVVGVMAYIQLQPKPNSQPQPTPTQAPSSAQTDETANWKTYKHNSLTFKYPSNWTSDNSGVASENIRISIETEVNYNINTGKPYSSVKEFQLESDEKEINTIQVGGMEALRSTYSNSGIWIRTFTRDKSNLYVIYFWPKNLTKDRKILETIISSIKISDESIDLTADWKTYANSSPKLVFKYPPFYIIKQENNTIKFISEDVADLIVTFNKYSTNYNSYPQCSSLPDSTKDTECVSEVTGTLLGGKKARVFGYSAGTDTGRVIIQSLEPKVELDMFVAGGGLSEIFNQILSTFKFLD